MNSRDNQELLTRLEAAQAARVSARTIDAWKARGLVPFLKLGRRVVFDRSELIAAVKRIAALNAGAAQ